MSPARTWHESLDRFADLLIADMVVLTGAGVSAASGLPTFRGTAPDAIWNRDVITVATFDAFRRDPAATWRWYLRRFRSATTARPNAAHDALVGLERWLAERGIGFLLVTQNIDTLHDQAGSLRLVKVHGSADLVRCSAADCPAANVLRRSEEIDFEPFDRTGDVRHIPQCTTCGALLRPHVLFFDEWYGSHPAYGWKQVMDAAAQMKLLLCVGTSFSVGVTAFLLQEARRRGALIAVVDPRDVVEAGAEAIGIRGQAETVLPILVHALNRKRVLAP